MQQLHAGIVLIQQLQPLEYRTDQCTVSGDGGTGRICVLVKQFTWIWLNAELTTFIEANKLR